MTHFPKNFSFFFGRERLDKASQRSLHNAPIFRLLLKVAVNGTHQCDFLNFCGALGLQQPVLRYVYSVHSSLLHCDYDVGNGRYSVCRDLGRELFYVQFA